MWEKLLVLDQCRVAMQERCTKFRDPESIIIRGIRMNLKDA